ncbi:MAG TPA: hypothetical protein VFW40_13990 [Capsulimonadaceae bacterium]|nr:hypothetical protein [Capsulimonadaceae bacterium]
MRKPEGEHYEAYQKLVQELIDEGYPIQAAKMFGMPSIKHSGGKAVGGFFEDNLIVKLSGEALSRAREIPGAELFDPMGGRPMKEWVQVPASQRSEWRPLLLQAIETAG